MARDGQFTATHAEMCARHLGAYDHYTAQIAELDVIVDRHAAPFAAVIAHLMTIPGIGLRTAQVIVAETGGDMSRFATPGTWPSGPDWPQPTANRPARRCWRAPAKATNTWKRR